VELTGLEDIRHVRKFGGIRKPMNQQYEFVTSMGAEKKEPSKLPTVSKKGCLKANGTKIAK